MRADSREADMKITGYLNRHSMRTAAAFAAAAFVVLFGATVHAQSPSGISGVVAPGVEPELVQEGFIFTEGPVGTPDGGLYFSDIRPSRIYHLDPNGKIDLVHEQTNGANGLALNGLTLTRDGKTLIVDDTIGTIVFAYNVQPDGSVKDKRTLAQLREIPEGKESGADGMALDRDDRVYITTVTGIQVFDAGGQYLGTIKVPRQPANVAFAGPDKRTLYITAREGLYRLKMLAQGPDRVGK